ncbi:MAG: sensor histidine kinase [Spirochaetaceae bacterium]
MRRLSPTTHPKTLGLIAIISIYAVLIVLILLYANRLLTEISRGTLLSRIIFIPLAVLLPAFLLLTIGYNVIRIIQEKKSGRPGIRFKVRLILFFTFITFLSAIPQGVLSISFIRTAMESWFSTQLSGALKGGLDITMDYNSEITSNLETFTKGEVCGSIIASAQESPESAWRTLRTTYPQTDAFELFNEKGERVFSAGREETLFGTVPPSTEGGLLPRTQKSDVSIIRSVRRVDTDDRTLKAVLSVALPQGFDQKALELTAALRTFRQYSDFQNTFLLAILVFYSLFSLPILLLSVLVGFHLSEEIIRPLVHMEAAIQRVISGDYSFRILSQSGNEISILVHSFNTMVSELEQSRTQIRQTEKVTAWQEIAQRMAHEIKNPLTPIRLSAERVRRAYKANSPRLGEIIDSSVHSIINEVGNLDKLIGEFRDFARVPTPAFREKDIRELLIEAAEPYRRSYPQLYIDEEKLSSHLIPVDEDQLGRAFSNLIKNSVEAMGGKGTVFFRCDLVRKGHTHYCRIQIEDTGEGIDPEKEDKVFHPYYTTKDDGTGLGLPIVERTIADHNGQIWFESQKGEGTTFFIDLPVERA